MPSSRAKPALRDGSAPWLMRMIKNPRLPRALFQSIAHLVKIFLWKCTVTRYIIHSVKFPSCFLTNIQLLRDSLCNGKELAEESSFTEFCKSVVFPGVKRAKAPCRGDPSALIHLNTEHILKFCPLPGKAGCLFPPANSRMDPLHQKTEEKTGGGASSSLNSLSPQMSESEA